MIYDFKGENALIEEYLDFAIDSKGEAVFETEGDARNAGTQTLTIPNDFSGDSVECYISFISADGLSVTNSKYVGSVSVV